MAKWSAQLVNNVRNVLQQRYFSNDQIERLIPKLHDELVKQPKFLAEIIDHWNIVMGNSKVQPEDLEDLDMTPSLAVPSPTSMLGKASPNLNMTHILADIEPDLLLLDPDRLLSRYERIRGLGIAQDAGQMWTLLFNAPRGFYLQDWRDLRKKIYYIEENVLDLLYDKKEQKQMERHPLLRAAACVECDFDHIRARYLFAQRTGYKALSHLFPVQTAATMPGLRDIILASDVEYLQKFAPNCSDEDYNCFSDLIKNTELDEEDADVISAYADLDALSIKCPKTRPPRPIIID